MEEIKNEELETELDEEVNELVMTAMQIILHAGDARLKITQALAAAKRFDFIDADALMKEAEADITLSHKSQTEVVQNEMSGHTYDYSLLFTHAQDTLMTIKSELNMAREMIDILRILEERTK